MKEITLVSTIHNENGAANAPNLNEIMQQIQPEVIFLEVSPDDFESCYVSSSRKSLESKAVHQYTKSRSTALVPVDLSVTDKDLHMKAQRLSRAIPIFDTHMSRNGLFTNKFADFSATKSKCSATFLQHNRTITH